MRAVEKDGKAQPAQIYLLDTTGGEARPITSLPRGAGAPVWSPDGQTLRVHRRRRGTKGRKQQGGRKNNASDVKVITRAVYRANGTPGYVDTEHHSHIFALSMGTSSPRQITDGEFDEREPVWSLDGSTIYFVSTRVAEPYYENSDAELYSVPSAGGAIAKIASIDGGIGNLSVSPDGRRIAFVGTLRGKPIRSYSQPDLWVSDLAPGSVPRNLTASTTTSTSPAASAGINPRRADRTASRLSGHPTERR